MNDLQKMTLEEKIEYLRQNPIFWTRLGFEKETGGWHLHVKNAERHKTFFEKGIIVHSSIIPIGWTGPDKFDFTETDKYFDLIFSTCPDLVFLPRIKVNVPEGWCEQNPDDVFVYGCGPRKREDIIALIGSEAHGSHPFKMTDMIAQQSFFSKKWIADASEALKRFVNHVENSKWADNIIGYHIAYGTSGETAQWGTWQPDPFHKGDYGISATKAFIDYAKSHGKDYDSVPELKERFYIEDGAPVHKFQHGTPTLDTMFFHTEQDEKSVLYSIFQGEGNMDALESFGKVVKDIVPDKIVGGFYGYILEESKTTNMQHSAYDRLLNSPYIDFVASPKGYVRISPTDPGLGQAITNSINRKKLWVDELDNRTHLVTTITRPEHDYPAKNFDQTRAVYWREFTKNVMHHQGYWWMDLGGGWLDDAAIQDEIALMHSVSKQLYSERDTHKSTAEVLLVVNENTMHRMRPNSELTASVHHIGSVIKECGVPIDLYRTADLDEIDISQYKIIIFLNEYYADIPKLKEIIEKTSQGCHIVWNYTAGIINKADNSYGLENVLKLTGFSLTEYPKGSCDKHIYPLVQIKAEDGVDTLENYPDGNIKTAKRENDGHKHTLFASPSDLTVEIARKMLESAGVHTYAPPYCVVHGDNRFIYVLSEKTQTVEITLKEPVTCKNVFTGEVYKNADSITLDMEEGTCVFLKYEE